MQGHPVYHRLVINDQHKWQRSVALSTRGGEAKVPAYCDWSDVSQRAKDGRWGKTIVFFAALECSARSINRLTESIARKWIKDFNTVMLDASWQWRFLDHVKSFWLLCSVHWMCHVDFPCDSVGFRLWCVGATSLWTCLEKCSQWFSIGNSVNCDDYMSASMEKDYI